MYALIPPIRNFRAPSLSMFLVFISFSVLAAMGLQRAFASAGDPRARTILGRALGIGALVSLLLGVVMLADGGPVIASLLGVGDAPRAPLLATVSSDIALMCIMAAFFLGLAWGVLFAAARGMITPRAAVIGLLAITAVDELRVVSRFVTAEPFSNYFPDDPSIRGLREALAPGERVYAHPGTYPSGYLATYRVPEVFGYHGNQLRWYDEFTRRFEREDPVTANERTLQFLLSPAMQALSVRYMVLPPVDVPLTGWELVGRTQSLTLWRSERALKGAAVVSHLLVEPDSNKALSALWTPGFDPGTTATVSAPVPGLSGTLGTGTFEITGFAPDTVAASVKTDGPTFFVLSQNWHPYWQVEVDGAPAEVVRADYTLMGVALPAAGDHRVVFRYRSPTVARGAAIARVAWGLVILMSLVTVGLTFRRRKVVA
jgi:hypothetical protein